MDLEPAAVTADRCLAAVADRLDYLLAVTPIDTDAAWRAFEASAFAETPPFTYRPILFDPAAERAQLASAPIDAITDPALAGLLQRVREELHALCCLVEARETDTFLELSAKVHGGVGDVELGQAVAVLDAVHGWPSDWAVEAVDAHGFAEAARAELGRLRARHPDLQAGIELRDDVDGVLVVRRTLLVDTRYRIDPRRVPALVAHEVGTHIVTEVNGSRQPLRCLQTGLAGYEETQEGVAVVAEHLAGGLTAERLALLGARVLVTRRRIDAVPFPETVDELCRDHGFSRRAAFDVVVRVHRGGGLLKDAVYLRGLGRALDHLREGGDLDPLLVGKVDLRDVEDIADLLHRGVLTPPVIRPPWSDRLVPSDLPADVVALAAAVAADEAL